ncbi:MAG: hypothetical protein Q9204_009362, partial [Flavoplaca sp. TL-2023a]
GGVDEVLELAFGANVNDNAVIVGEKRGDQTQAKKTIHISTSQPQIQNTTLSKPLQIPHSTNVTMPRSMAPPPSGEFSITLTKPFSPTTTPSSKIEIIGEPNRPATIKHTQHVGAQAQTLIIKEGSIDAEDSNELMDLIKPLAGFPSDPNSDVYGLDTRLDLATFEVQWDNGEEVEGAEAKSNPTDENKQTFKDVVESIEALTRQKAKQRTS